ncbi:FkbM family methyltransferase [Paracoccus sp. IB05]|uniref:FkbM family methyltransferase n=1 Tax=Paracoccus sp. IB05 TaxID=2779367 RepID=UPI0018E71FFB|nr:FkbM family methyltransferase [Paracoccus sp. IB05]MBJ2153793.1 FkbM family methyltransferase [Paracoccus sp. IB05]
MTEATLTIVATCHGVEVPDAPILGPRMIEAMNNHRYERQEIECGLAVIPKGARILEMGAGAGVVGAVLAKNCAPVSILSIEANPGLLPHINRLYEHNGLQDLISVRHSVVFSAPDAPGTVTFNVAGNFLGSSLAELPGKKTRAVEVPVLRYSDLTKEYPHDTIMMDIEGGELDFLRHADLSAVNTIVLEMHKDVYGREGMQECHQLFRTAGLSFDEENSASRVHVWRRG